MVKYIVAWFSHSILSRVIFLLDIYLCKTVDYKAVDYKEITSAIMGISLIVFTRTFLFLKILSLTFLFIYSRTLESPEALFSC